MWLPGRCGGRQCSECSSFPSLGLSGMGLNVLRERAGIGCPPPTSCSVHGQHARAESAVTWRRLGADLAAGADYPCPEQGPVLVPGGRLGEGVAAALHSTSVAGLRRCRRPGPAREVADVLRARAPPGRGAPAGRCPGRCRGDRAGQARDHARQPGGADISPSAASVRPARAGAPGTCLPEPGLQGAQLRVVQVLAQPVRLLGGQAQRVAGFGRTAGQQLGLGQQPERERAVP